MIQDATVLERQNRLTLKKILSPDETNANVILWVKMNFPFVLPPLSYKYHKCKWCRIQQDIFGCSLCGEIHRCSCTNCKPFVTVTDEYEICTISGICLRTSQPSNGQEFHDQILYWPDAGMNKYTERHHVPDEFQIKSFIEELLLSAECYTLWQMKIKKIHAMICKSIETEFAKNVSFIDQFEHLIADIVAKQNVLFAFNRPLRETVAAECVDKILHILSLCSRQFKLGTKQNDLRNTVFGLMYLMREGVTFANVSVVPKINSLIYLLPAESCLFKSFHFKPKFITDIENRCKYGFRTGLINRSHIENLTQQK